MTRTSEGDVPDRMVTMAERGEQGLDVDICAALIDTCWGLVVETCGELIEI